jgi:uncharacterized protein YjiS (DUF1127 family)
MEVAMSRSITKEILIPADSVSTPVVEGLARLAGSIGGHWQAFRVWRDRVATIRELARLDERMLKDVGLSRHELGPLDEAWPESDADLPRWQQPELRR